MKRATSYKPSFFNSSAISIHALVKRATFFDFPELQACDISIHALVKRATTVLERYLVHTMNFNPRPREEGDKTL